MTLRRRAITNGFFKNEDLVEMPPLTRLLFIGLWQLADRDGLLVDKPRKIKLALFPYDDFNTDEALDALQQVGMITRYQGSEEQKLIHVVKFLEYQRPHPNETASILEKPMVNQRKTNGEPMVNHDPTMVNTLQSEPSVPSVPTVPSGVGIFMSGSGQPDPANGKNLPAVIGENLPAKAQPRIPYQQIISHLNERAGTRFRHETQATRNMIKARYKAGHTLQDFLMVIDGRVTAWASDPKMQEYLRPSTLFRPSNFENYLNGRQPAPAGQSSTEAEIDFAVRESAKEFLKSDENGSPPELPPPGPDQFEIYDGEVYP